MTQSSSPPGASGNLLVVRMIWTLEVPAECQQSMLAHDENIHHRWRCQATLNQCKGTTIIHSNPILGLAHFNNLNSSCTQGLADDLHWIITPW